MRVEEIVQNQLDAYNNRDILLFLSYYSDDIEIRDFEKGKPRIKGKNDLKNVYNEVFQDSPNLNAKIANRIVFDNKVIDHEQVTGRIGIDYIEVVAIYELKNGLISRVTFIRKN